MDYKNSHVDFASTLMSRIFLWMSIALVLTGSVAYLLANSPEFMTYIIQHPFLFIAILLSQIFLVLGMQLTFSLVNYPVLLGMFLLYALLTGVTFSTLFWIYQASSIALVFFITAGMFLSMALYGITTRHDLTSMGSLLGMTLWGLLLAMLVNIYFKSSAFEMVLSFLGVIIFSGLTAYDVQKLKKIAEYTLPDPSLSHKFTLLGAFTLYLDFINLFLFALQLFGKKKESQ